jgi:hypothetical protein
VVQLAASEQRCAELTVAREDVQEQLELYRGMIRQRETEAVETASALLSAEAEVAALKAGVGAPTGAAAGRAAEAWMSVSSHEVETLEPEPECEEEAAADDGRPWQSKSRTSSSAPQDGLIMGTVSSGAGARQAAAAETKTAAAAKAAAADAPGGSKGGSKSLKQEGSLKSKARRAGRPQSSHPYEAPSATRPRTPPPAPLLTLWG